MAADVFKNERVTKMGRTLGVRTPNTVAIGCFDEETIARLDGDLHTDLVNIRVVELKPVPHVRYRRHGLSHEQLAAYIARHLPSQQ